VLPITDAGPHEGVTPTPLQRGHPVPIHPRVAGPVHGCTGHTCLRRKRHRLRQLAVSEPWSPNSEARYRRREWRGWAASRVSWMGWKPAPEVERSGWPICWTCHRVRLCPTHSGIPSSPKREGWRPRPHPVSALRFALLRAAACGRALVSCLADAVHASRRNRRADFNHPTRPPA